MCIQKRSSEMVAGVPTISLDDPNTELLKYACERFGTVYLTSDSIQYAISQAKAVTGPSRQFFAKPEDVKARYQTDRAVLRGFTPQPKPTADKPHFSNRRETFAIGTAAKQINTDRAYSVFTAPNTFPSQEDAPGFADAFQTYYNTMQSIAPQVCSALEAAMGLEKGKLQAMMKAQFITSIGKPGVVTYLHTYVAQYEATQSVPEQNDLGLGAHKDVVMFTLLYTEPTEGLEILVDDVWHPVAAKPDCLIMNLGTTTERLTNGVFSGITHRVNNRTGNERYSVATFCGADPHSELAPLPGFVTADRPQKWPTCLGAEHHVEFYKGVLHQDAWKQYEATYDALISDAKEMRMVVGKQRIGAVEKEC